MAKFCEFCGKEFSFFAWDNIKILFRETLCKDCRTVFESKLSKIERDVLATKSFNTEQLETLKKLDKNSLICWYSKIYNSFESDKELDKEEIETLLNLQKELGLTNDEIKFDDRIKPYIYVYKIRKEGILPIIEVKVNSGHIIFKKGEVAHHFDCAVLKEMKSVSLGYSGGSQGVSIRVMKGVSYRVGSHSGHIQRENRLVETSKGFLFITNMRIFLHPYETNKPASIPLNKILSYPCFGNGIQIYKEGREKGYFFEIGKSSSVEIFGLCLGHLLE